MTHPLALWDFDDPAGSRARFAAAAEAEQDPGRRRVWLTQVARAHGLAGEYAEAHAVLDTAGESGRGESGGAAGESESGRGESGHALGEGGDAGVALERGRVLRSSGDVAGSIPLFRKAFDQALAAGERGLAADAAHMLALVLPEEHEAWAARGLQVAEDGVDDPLAWAMTGALLNNLGWTLAEQDRWAEAHELFDRAVGARQRVAAAVGGKASADSLHAARWTRARAARALGRNEQALAELRELDPSDPYVAEEISLLEAPRQR
ncbi:MAG TPA: tetratricopeptide repeat protein [Candidatus Limnocylindrales bacterium]